jgi:hypothetical protein
MYSIAFGTGLIIGSLAGALVAAAISVHRCRESASLGALRERRRIVEDLRIEALDSARTGDRAGYAALYDVAEDVWESTNRA